MKIRIATHDEYNEPVQHDHPVSSQMLARKIEQQKLIVAIENDSVIAW